MRSRSFSVRLSSDVARKMLHFVDQQKLKQSDGIRHLIELGLSAQTDNQAEVLSQGLEEVKRLLRQSILTSSETLELLQGLVNALAELEDEEAA